MPYRFLSSLAGLLTAVCLVRAQPPEPPPAPMSSTTAPVPRPAMAISSDDPLPWPTSPLPAFGATNPSLVPAKATDDGQLLIPVVGTVEAAPPGYLPSMTAPSLAPAAPGTGVEIVPDQAPPPVGLFARLRRYVTPDTLPEPVMLGAGQFPGGPPAPGIGPPGVSPSEPLRPPEAQPAPEPIEEPTGKPYVPGRIWIGAEALLWLIPRGPLPIPLLTTGPAQINPLPGALNQSNTSVLVNTNFLRYDVHSGGRGVAGFWLTDNHILGMEANGFYSEANEIRLRLADRDTTSGVLARPFINARNIGPAANLISFPANFSGAVEISSESRLYGGEANFVGKLLCRDTYAVDVLAGARYIALSEKLEITSVSVTVVDGVQSFNNVLQPAGTTVLIQDRFAGKNHFEGAQIGVRTIHHLGLMDFSLLFKVAFGATQQTVDIQGATTRVLLNGTIAALPAGLLALGSNSGTIDRTVMSVVPQFQMNVAYQCKSWLRLFVNYDYLYWSHIVRPGDQIDPFINPLLIPTFLGFNPAANNPLRPLVPLRERNFWVQGLTLGVEISY